MLRAEIETIVRWDRTSDPATFYTADPREAQKLQRVGLKPVEIDTDPGGQVRSWRFEVPRDWLRVKVRPKRQMSAAQRQNIHKARAARQAKMATELA